MKKWYFICLFLVVVGGLTQWWVPKRIYRHPREVPQTLFVAFDAIPFSLVEKLYAEGKLEKYLTPSKIISTFPSTTTSGFTGLLRPLGAEPAPGYDAKYFSYEKKKVLGNFFGSYDIGGKNYVNFFSYIRSSRPEQLVMYTAPEFSLKIDFSFLKEIVWNNPQKEKIFFYIGATDSTAHLDGYEATEKIFLETIEKIEHFKKEYAAVFGQNLRVVLFSDHGFHWDQMKPIDISELDTRLQKVGLKLSKKMVGPSDVVAITWGNISGGDFYTLPENEKKVVSLLLETPGIDLVMYRKNGEIIVEGMRGVVETAKIVFDESGEHFGYIPVSGDPLRYTRVIMRLEAEGKFQNNWPTARDWLEATKDHQYPDALYRIWDAFDGLAKNPATLLVSTLEDYELGEKLTRYGAKFRGGLLGTHGALTQNSSAGFITSDDPAIPFPPVVRYDQALVPFVEK